MKAFKVFLILVSFIISYNIFACFMDDPKYLFNQVIVKQFQNGAIWQVQFPKILLNENIQITNNWLQNWLNINYSDHIAGNQQIKNWYKTINNSDGITEKDGVIATFPLTINCEFSGFEDDQNKITRFCLLYWGKNKKWTMLKDIKNPTFTVVSNTGDKKSLFGKYVVQNSYGFKPGEILFITCYYETQSGLKTHSSLENLLKLKPYQTDGCIKIGVIENVKPK